MRRALRVPRAKVSALAGASLLSGLLGACTGDGSTKQRGTGFLSLDWTLEGAADPARCDVLGAESLELTVLGSDAEYISEAQVPCRERALTIELGPGPYTARATLVNAEDTPVTRRLPLGALTIATDERLVLELDFGAGDLF